MNDISFENREKTLEELKSFFFPSILCIFGQLLLFLPCTTVWKMVSSCLL
jgi:hypothetical protein